MAVISFGSVNTPRDGKRRVNGFSLPLYYVQLIAIAVIIFLVLMNYLTLCVNIPVHPWQWLSIVLSSILILPFLVVFICLTYIDPAEDEVIRQRRGPRTDFNRQIHQHVITDLYCHVCDVHVTANAKHCSSCNKCVYSFDHHCIWLNTCVGGKNYRLFLTMLFLIVFGTLLIFFNGLLQFIGSFKDSSSPLALKPYYDTDRYAILMIPSSLIAFQIMTAITAFIAIVAWALTAYLFAFHIYLCFYHLSTYDYVISRRVNRTVDQTMFEFNQLSRFQQQDASITKQPSGVSKIFSKNRKTNRVTVTDNNGMTTHADVNGMKTVAKPDIFTVEGNQRDSPRRLQMCQNSNENAYVLNSPSQMPD